MAYYRRAMQHGLPKFVRFAKNVWDINGERLRVGDGTSGIGRTDEQIAEVGLEALKNWMLEIGLPLTINEIGATPDMIPGITEGTICYPAGYMDLKPEDITEILKESM
jgi:alcohol dehydrogenase YqhD (iron-dependent ADH family)